MTSCLHDICIAISDVKGRILKVTHQAAAPDQMRSMMAMTALFIVVACYCCGLMV